MLLKNSWKWFVVALVSIGMAIKVGSALAYELPSSASEVCPIKVGQKIPKLSLTDINGQPFDLNAAVASKPTILVFYRGSWCPYCNLHLAELRKIEPEILKLGYQIIAVSPDLPENLKTAVKNNDLAYQVVSDSKATAIRALGLAFTETKKSYLKLLEDSSGENHHILPVPAALVLNQSGEVTFSFYSPDYSVRVNTDVLLAAAKSEFNRIKLK